MADQINTSAPQGDSSGSNMVAIVALVILVALAVVFVVYGLPALQKPPEQTPPAGSINIQLPPATPEPQPEPAPKP